jgi:cysteinyl-tRNA synthetase
MANFWMHNGFLQVEGEKMSKSLGNFLTIHDLLKDWPGEVLRFNMLRTHYRQPIDWTLRGLEESYASLRSLMDGAEAPGPGEIAAGVLDALCDDLNTPKAIAELYAMHGRGEAAPLAATLAALGFARRPQSRRKVDEAAIVALIDRRRAARTAKNFAESDRIRDELQAMGVILKDSKEGTTWELAP